MKSNTITPITVAALTALAFAVPCSAATLATYDIETNGAVADATNAADMTASTLDASSADGTSTNFEWVGTRVPFWQRGNTGELNKGTDPGIADIILTWNLTPDAGNQIVILTTDALSYGVLAQTSSVTLYEVTTRVFVASDAAFTNILATSTTLSDIGNGGTSPTLGSVNFDQLISSADTLYFGLAALDNNEATGTPDARVDGITVTGTVSSIPEPSTGLLVAFAASTSLLRRRRA